MKLDVSWQKALPFKVADFIGLLNFEWHGQDEILSFLCCAEIVKNFSVQTSRVSCRQKENIFFQEIIFQLKWKWAEPIITRKNSIRMPTSRCPPDVGTGRRSSSELLGKLGLGLRGEIALYSWVQCSMGNGHMASPPVDRMRETRPSHSFVFRVSHFPTRPTVSDCVHGSCSTSTWKSKWVKKSAVKFRMTRMTSRSGQRLFAKRSPARNTNSPRKRKL